MADLVGGMTHVDIAKKHGVSLRTVARAAIAARPQAMDAFDAQLAAIRSLAPDAIATLKDALSCPDDKVRVAAANSLLDRGGYVKTERREISGPDGGPVGIQVVLTTEQRAALARRRGE